MFRLSTILIARFLLHLQSASLRAVGSVPSLQVSSMCFNGSMIERVVGSLGASIAVDDYLEQDRNPREESDENLVSVQTREELH